MSDLISRSKAIRWVKAECNPYGQPTLDYESGRKVIEHLERMPSAEPKTPSNGSITCMKPKKMHDRTMGDLISRQKAKDAIDMALDHIDHVPTWVYDKLLNALNEVPSAEPERLTDDDFETIRIHLNAYKEKLCNQQRWKEAEEYQHIIDRFMAFASAEPEPIRINLNEPIKVKLTDLGKEIYYHQYDRINQIYGREICKPSLPKEDENGYAEFQLWCFMELYGMHIGMTLPNVIEPIEIVYER